MTPASENTTNPPTLLRLPDLDPEASSMLQTVQPTEHEIAPSTPAPSPVAKPKAALPTGLSKSSSLSSDRAIASSAVERPSPGPSSEPRPSVEPSESSSFRESDSPQVVRGDSRIAEASFSSDESDSWLTAFASRKTLLVLLALIAGLAIFFPRGDHATSEQVTPLLVEDSAPEPTVIPFQLERYPATRLESPIASATKSVAPAKQLADPAKLMPASPTSMASIPLRQPGDTIIKDEIASVNEQPSSLVPQPPKTPWDEQSGDEPMESPTRSMGPLNAALSLAQTKNTSPYQQTLSPQSPVIDPSLAGNADKALSQSMANAYGGTSVASDKSTETPARLVNSRTPQGIFNWKKFLPPINIDSAADSPVSPDASQGTSALSAMPEIRTSSAPVAPSFEFALPGGTNPVASGAADSTDSIQSNSNGSPASGPEARVAMPPQSSLR